VKEIQIQRELSNHPNVLKIIKVYETDEYINLLMETQEGGCLGTYLASNGKMKEERARQVAI
jgi:serine/threonine protein kinase